MGRRSGEAQAALGRKAPVMKHRLEPRGGSQPAIEREECSVCLGSGMIETCLGCDELTEDCECDYPEGDPPGVLSDACPECDR